MRKTLLAIAFAGAALAPGLTATVAATLVPAGAAVAAPKLTVVKVRRAKIVRRPDLNLVARCPMPHLSVRREAFKLHLAGYRHIHFVRKTTFLPRCAQFLYYSACKGPYRYRVIVRYIKYTRFVITQRLGFCLYLRKPVLKRP
jgi:hypothetical protein